MNQPLIKELQVILNNYRSHDGVGSFRITDKGIYDWVMQFETDDQDFIISELKHIFAKCYYNKTRTKNHLKILVTKLGEKLGYKDNVTFLKDSVFLNCQSEGKSQSALLLLIKEFLKQDFAFDINEAGSVSRKNYIYVDDILCTGKTFYDNISSWGDSKDSDLSYIARLRKKDITLNVLYLSASYKSYEKKMGQLYYHFDKNFNERMITTLVGRWIDKNNLKPVDKKIKLVSEYEQEVINSVDEYVSGKYSAEPVFYRLPDANFKEEFFSSADNRTRLEYIFLVKGIEILKRANAIKQNVRPLGFTLPSYKNFGFGAMFFTWRNVPNNTPLVFWYRGGGFTPLFENVR